VSSLFDHLALAAGGDSQIRPAQALALTTAVEGRPVLATAFPEAHTFNSELRIIIKRGF
jgi:hypothetical protein